MQDITAIEPDWLYTLAGHYYQYGTVCLTGLILCVHVVVCEIMILVKTEIVL